MLALFLGDYFKSCHPDPLKPPLARQNAHPEGVSRPRAVACERAKSHGVAP